MRERERWRFSRFIPAYAGNARYQFPLFLAFSVHPRIRGERWSGQLPHLLRFGSSPHTRGTPKRASFMAASVRFIPAYAGNAQIAYIRGKLKAVHPRIRGERAR